MIRVRFHARVSVTFTVGLGFGRVCVTASVWLLALGLKTYKMVKLVIFLKQIRTAIYFMIK